MDSARGASLAIGPRLEIPAEELRVETARAGGPGGQHVNKVETRVTLRFDVEGSRVLSESQRERLRQRLAGRINRAGELVVHSGRRRSQLRNLEDARERLAELVRGALAPVRPRKATRPTRASKKRRLDEKRRRGERKRERGPPAD